MSHVSYSEHSKHNQRNIHSTMRIKINVSQLDNQLQVNYNVTSYCGSTNRELVLLYFTFMAPLILE